MDGRDNALVDRRARKAHECRGVGRPSAGPRHAEGCDGQIKPGDLYIENLDSASAYESGTRYSLACAREMFDLDTEVIVAARKAGT